jgi:putative ABC transport system permease protein
MPILSRISSVWNTLFRKERLDRELDDELSAAIETLSDRYVASGMDATAARRAAVAALGGHVAIDQMKADVRDGRVGAGLDALLLDLRYAWRGLSNAPAFTIVIVLTLALGIGANTAIFSVVHAMLLAPLPYRDSDRLVFIWADRTATGYPRAPLSGPELADLREGSTTCADFAAIWASGTVALTGNGEDPEQLRSAFVTANFFQVLGVDTVFGRLFRPGDSAEGAAPTILLGWDLFQRRFGADPSIVGKQILVNEQLTTVIGVMPRDFRLLMPLDSSVPDRLQAWHPFWESLERDPRQNRLLRVIGRMQPGVTVAQARADIAGVAERVSRQIGIGVAFTTVRLQEDDVREIRAPLVALFVGVSILLMIACVNVAGLLIARAASRASEAALRLALGASRSRLVRQHLVEGLFLTLVGAVAGVIAGSVALRMLLAFAPESLSRISSARINPTVLAFTAGISVIWGVLLSLAPLIQLFQRNSQRPLGASRRVSATPVRYRIRAALVVVQIALSVVLLAGAGLMLRAFVEVLRVDPGFRADRHLTFRIAIPEQRYSNETAVIAFSRELRHRLAAIPGVTGVGAISNLPYDDLPNWALSYRPDVAGDIDASLKHEGAPSADTRAISKGLFETLGVRLIEGRFFTDDDDRSKRPVVIIDDMLARQLWPNRSALGRQFLIGQGIPEQRASVVGVVRHVRLRSLVSALTPQIFIPIGQWQRDPMAFVVETDLRPAAIVPEIRAAVRSLDPRLPIYDVRAMATYVEAARAMRRFTVGLAGAFALVALALTSIGVYGVLAYTVALRRHEFGVRRALGAEAGQVMWEVLREGLGFALTGCVAGLAIAAVAAGLIQNQLYGVHPRDPVSHGVAIALIVCGALVACWIPARRAIAVSPMDALRSE